MASLSASGSCPQPRDAAWRTAGLRYYSRSFFCRAKFGRRVWKISLDGQLGCPNRDGTLAVGGCVFCDPESFSPSRRLGAVTIAAQLDAAIGRLSARRQADRFVAYFQPGSNTYGPLPRLKSLYQEAISHPQVIGLAVGTRPDCVPDAVLDLLAEMATRTWLTVEYGLQTVHNRTLDWLNRGHHYDAFLDAAQRSRRRGLAIGVHVILGLPGEGPDDMIATARELARLGVESVKLHNLYAVRNTPLARLVATGDVKLIERDEYVCRVVDFLEQLPADCVVDRLVGDAPSSYLVAPAWCLEKGRVKAGIEAEFQRRDSWQGKKRA
ncbi:MAG: TIGR01212 family radical SAM protein [Thermoguttaceae bacterium]|jgi:radical SAM protein (TIGR01212 family)